MHQIKRVKSEEIFPIIKEILEKNGTACITVTGMSMYPFLRENIDSVEISHAGLKNICHGDIVLIQREDGQYILHRVIWKNTNAFYIVGDAQQWIEGPLLPDRLIGVVTAVWRRDRRIQCKNIGWLALSWIWILLLPFRGLIRKAYIVLRKLTKRARRN